MLLFLLATAVASAQPVRVAGSRVLVEPPVGYVAAETFSGFQHEPSGAALLVVELPGATFEQIREGLTAEALAARGVLVDDTEETTVDGHPALLVRGRQPAYGVRFAKWILVTGDSLGVVMVTAQVPEDADEAVRGKLAAALQTVRLGAAVPEDPFEGLPFTFDLPGGLPDRQRVGASLLLADGFGPGLDPGRPVYSAAMGLTPFPEDLEGAAERRLGQTTGIQDLGTPESRAVTVDGRPGIEHVARAVDDDERTPLVVYQVIVPTEATYVIVQGLVGADRADEWLPRFREATASIRWR